MKRSIRSQTDTSYRAQLHSIVSNTPDGIITLTDHYEINIINSIAVKLITGNKEKLPSEFIDQDFISFINVFPELREEFLYLIKNGDASEFTLPNTEHLGRILKISCLSMLHGYLLIIQDVSRESQLVDEIKENAAKLSAEVATKNKFFSIVSHDLRSPFTALLLMTQLLSEMSDKSTRRKISEYAHDVNKSAERVFYLLENLLSWSRIQMDDGHPVYSQFCISELAHESISAYQESASLKNISVIKDLRAINVSADRGMIGTVIRNLFANAIKFTPEDGRITITVDESDDDFILTVADTGVGMRPEYAERIFSLDDKTTQAGTNGESGTGLGLPLCREMVETHGGAIAVQTSEGAGAVFRVSLPKTRG